MELKPKAGAGTSDGFADGAYLIEITGPWGACGGRAIVRGGSVQAWSPAMPGRVLMGVADANDDNVSIELSTVDQPIGDGPEPCKRLPASLSLKGVRTGSVTELLDATGLYRVRLAPDLAARAAG